VLPEEVIFFVLILLGDIYHGIKCKKDFVCVRFFLYPTVPLSSVGIAVPCGFCPAQKFSSRHL
jgi:hypothetical protein